MEATFKRLVHFIIQIFPSDPTKGQIGSIDMNISLAYFTALPLHSLKQEQSSWKFLLIGYALLIIPPVTFLYPVFEIYDLAGTFNDLDAFTQNTCLTLAHFSSTWKVANTLWSLSEIRVCIEKLRAITKKYTISAKQREAFMRGELENKIFLSLYASLVGFTALLADVMLILYPYDTAGQIFPYRVRLPMWMSFNVQIIYITITLVISALQIVALDYINISLMNHLRYQLDILIIAFEDIKALTANYVLLQMNKRAMRQLKMNMQHHIALMDLRQDVENVYRYPILLQFMTSLLIFGLTGFRATVSDGSGKGDMVIYCYVGCILCELFFYCWFGNEVLEKFKALSMSAFSCPWYEFDKEFQKSLLIFLPNAQRPFLFTAGGFMGLSLPSFTGILGKSYSFIALLRQFYSK